MTPEIYQRAADFLEGGDKPLAETVLESGRKHYPEHPRWPSSFGRHYAQAILGSAEPLTEYNVFRQVSAEEAQSSYAQKVRLQLAESRDVRILAETAMHLFVWGRHFQTARMKDKPAPWDRARAALDLARTYLDRALSIEPENGVAQLTKSQFAELESNRRAEQLAKLSPAEFAAAPAADRMRFAMNRMRISRFSKTFKRPKQELGIF